MGARRRERGRSKSVVKDKPVEKDGEKQKKQKKAKDKPVKKENKAAPILRQPVYATRLFTILAALALFGAPLVLRQLVGLTIQHPLIDTASSLGFVEFFAGKAEVTRAMQRSGRCAFAYELNNDPLWQNMNSAEGFLHALSLVLRLPPGGGVLMAPVCSSWVFMSRGSTGRCLSNPLGWQDRPSVKDGNLMVSRCSLLSIVILAIGAWIILEQPLNSLMEAHPRFQKLVTYTDFWRYHVQMRDFGGPTAKPTWLYTSRQELRDLLLWKAPKTRKSSADVEMVRRYQDADGNTKITGGRDLKTSQHYPRGFGEAVSKFYSAHEDLLQQDGQEKLDHAVAHARNMEPLASKVKDCEGQRGRDKVD